MDLGLDNKLVLVTGSTEGIGLAIAREFVAQGARVVLNGRSQDKIDRALAEINGAKPKHEAVGVAADLGTADGAAALIRGVEELGDLTVLVNNLGIFKVKDFTEASDEVWQQHWDVNVMSAVRLSRHFLPGMLERAKADRDQFGRILMMSSETGQRPLTQFLHYSVSKAALISLARGLAELCKGTSVTVNSVLAGPTATEGVDEYIADLAKEKGISTEEQRDLYFKENEPTSIIARFLNPQEVADATVFLASKRASGIVGHGQRVEGGVLKYM